MRRRLAEPFDNKVSTWRLVSLLVVLCWAAQGSLLKCVAKGANSNVSLTNETTQTRSNVTPETASSQNTPPATPSSSNPVTPTPSKNDLEQDGWSIKTVLQNPVYLIISLIATMASIAGGIWALLKFMSWLKTRKLWFRTRRWATSAELKLEEKTYLRSRRPAHHEKETVRYGVAVFQDTILPLFFDYVHRRALERHGLKIEFVQFQWGEGECRKKFLNGEIDVALHNLFSVVPRFASSQPDPKEPSIFVPFFDFSGQGIFIKESLLSKLDPYPDLRDCKTGLSSESSALFDESLDKKRQRLLEVLLAKTTAIVEFGTDMEIALKGLYDLAELNINKHEFELRPALQSEGYESFIDPLQNYDVFCGGLIHAYRLRNHPDKSRFVRLCVGRDLGIKSANGLVTTTEYAEQNPRIVRDLINVWYWSIREFTADVMACTETTAPACDLQRLDSILAFLGKALETSLIPGVDKEIDIELLKMMFTEGFEEFHTDLRTVVQSFYFSGDQKYLRDLVYVAKNAALSTVLGQLKTNLTNASVDSLADGIRKHHSRVLLPIIPEAC